MKRTPRAGQRPYSLGSGPMASSTLPRTLRSRMAVKASVTRSMGYLQRMGQRGHGSVEVRCCIRGTALLQTGQCCVLRHRPRGVATRSFLVPTTPVRKDEQRKHDELVVVLVRQAPGKAVCGDGQNQAGLWEPGIGRAHGRSCPEPVTGKASNRSRGTPAGPGRPEGIGAGLEWLSHCGRWSRMLGTPRSHLAYTSIRSLPSANHLSTCTALQEIN